VGRVTAATSQPPQARKGITPAGAVHRHLTEHGLTDATDRRDFACWLLTHPPVESLNEVPTGELLALRDQLAIWRTSGALNRKLATYRAERERDRQALADLDAYYGSPS
jgi:hypothetical protein